jgi:hypothetical protein
MDSATTRQSALPRAEAKPVPAHLPARAKEKMEASLGEKARAKEPLSGAKAHTAKA